MQQKDWLIRTSLSGEELAEGLLNLMDAIQDYCEDELGMNFDKL